MPGELHLLKSVKGAKREYAILSKGNVASVIEKVRPNYKARSFADLLIKDRNVGGLFFHNWRQLSLLPVISLPVFADTDRPLSGTDSLSIEAKEAAGKSGVAFESIVTIAEPLLTQKLEAMQARMKADGIDPGKASQETLGIFMFQRMGLLSGGSPLTAMLDLVRPFEDYFADEIGDFAFELLSAVKSGIRESGNDRTKRILKESTLTPQIYHETIQMMKESHFLRTGLSVHWCEGHADFPISLVTVGDSFQTSLSCRVCGKGLAQCNFLLPTSAAMIWVRQYHGIFQYLLPWTLEQNEIAWAANVFLEGVVDDTEKDLIFRPKGAKGITIVECKSDYTDSPERTVNQKLRDHLVQVSKAVHSYRKLGITVERAILATNNEATTPRADSVKQWIADDSDLESLRGLEVKLVGPNNLSDWWK
jgi:hypothetical protein